MAKRKRKAREIRYYYTGEDEHKVYRDRAIINALGKALKEWVRESKKGSKGEDSK